MQTKQAKQPKLFKSTTTTRVYTSITSKLIELGSCGWSHFVANCLLHVQSIQILMQESCNSRIGAPSVKQQKISKSSNDYPNCPKKQLFFQNRLYRLFPTKPYCFLLPLRVTNPFSNHEYSYFHLHGQIFPQWGDGRFCPRHHLPSYCYQNERDKLMNFFDFS